MGLGNTIRLFHKQLYLSTPPLLQIILIEVLDSLLASVSEVTGSLRCRIGVALECVSQGLRMQTASIQCCQARGLACAEMLITLGIVCCLFVCLGYCVFCLGFVLLLCLFGD